MMRYTVTILLTLCSLFLKAQPNARNADSIRRLSEADHRQMMEQLRIETLRTGVNGWDRNPPNPANYDEAKANPYPLPPLLTMRDGRVVRTKEAWERERVPELKSLFDSEVYGRTPGDLPPVSWKLVRAYDSIIAGIPVIVRELNGVVDNSSYPRLSVVIRTTLTLPRDIEKPVPLMIELGFSFPAGFVLPRDTSSNAPTHWTHQLLQNGWGFAVYLPTSVQADNGAGLTSGIIGLHNKGARRKPEDWGTLKAWAWGASRVLDGISKVNGVDANHVGITGHSRYGKAALVALAYDTRFFIGFISSSGAGGAKPHRRYAGEVLENLTHSSEYHWMAGNFLKYAGPLTADDLPVDAHELIAVCAPRPLFISSGDKGDAWVDARGMFMATLAAGEAYALYGKKGLTATAFPPVGKSISDGTLAFRQHEGGHTPAPNWTFFIEFAKRYIQPEARK